MTVNLETEVVATGYNAAEQTCLYTIERGGKRWTVSVPLKHLEAHGGNRAARRNHLANVLENAMQGAHDIA